MDEPTGTPDDMRSELEDLTRRVAEAEQTLTAIKMGEIDALVISTAEGERVFTLKGADEPYRILVETINEGAVTIGPDGTILYCNLRFAEMLGLPMDNVSGSSVYRFISPEDKKAFDSLVSRGKEGGNQGEFSLSAASGKPVPVYLSVGALDLDGIPAASIAVTDLSDLKRLEKEYSLMLESEVNERTRELESTKRELERTNDDLVSYAHTVSHDLRNPLSAISLAMTLLREAVEEVDGDGIVEFKEEAIGSIRVVDGNVSRSFALIEDLLVLAEAGQQPKTVESVDIARVIQTILDAFMAELSGRGVRLRLSNDLGVVQASQTQMYQLFLNLIDNGIKHNVAREPELLVEYLGRGEGDDHRYRVCDNGAGIPEDALDEIFMPFYRRGKSARSGIGLATVQRIIDVYGGNIRAYNDGGACFDFTINDMPDSV